MKYLMVWMGVTSGSHLGRDDGYPEQKTRIIENFDELVHTYRDDAEYYKLDAVDVKPVVEAAKDFGV